MIIGGIIKWWDEIVDDNQSNFLKVSNTTLLSTALKCILFILVPGIAYLQGPYTICFYILISSVLVYFIYVRWCPC